jgi:hypothetical protein
MMRHFSLQEWLDYANRNVAPDKRTFMTHHLEAGCSHCTQVAAHWKLLKQFAAAEASLQVSEEVVELAKRSFRIPRKAETRSIFETIAELVFDSFQQPVLAGVRSSTPSTRSLLYAAGALLIDLNFDVADNTGHIMLQGQVMDSQVRGKGMEEIPVSLRSGRETVAQTRTNEFGEFELKCDARKGLQVSVAVNPQRNVLILLDEAFWARQGFGIA